MTEFSLPDLSVTRDVIERIQFSVASRNAEAKLSECATHVFAAQYSDNPSAVQWQYVASGAACLLRNRELHKNGRKYMWSMSLCLYNVSYGVLVWKAKLLSNCDYTAISDNFHVFALGEVNVIVGLLFSSREQACELNTTYMTWHQARMRDDGKKGPSTVAPASAPAGRFNKKMISKPCNFQHIQGTQALDECLEIEKIKADILAAFFGLGTAVGRTEVDSIEQKKKKKKKDQVKAKPSFREIPVPACRTLSKSLPLSDGAAYAHNEHHVTNSYPPFEPQSAPPPLTSPNQAPVYPHPHEGATTNGVSPPPPQQASAYNYSQSNGYPDEHRPDVYTNMDALPNSQNALPANYTEIDSLPSESDHGGAGMSYQNIDSLPQDQELPPSTYTNIESLPEDQGDMYTNIDSLPSESSAPSTSYTNIDSLPSKPVESEANYANFNSLQQESENYANLPNGPGGQPMNYQNIDSLPLDSPPPRIDFDLEKELAGSFLFQSPLMSAN